MPQLIPQQPPPADYYAGNLRLLLTHVAEFYADLLTAQERGFIETLLGLPKDAQRLYARLLSRKGPWIRIEKLSYHEVADLPAALKSLDDAALVRISEAAPADALLGLLTQEERQRCFPDIPGATKARWITDCVSRHDDRWIRRQLRVRHPWVAVADYPLIRLCQLLFFGDDHQDTSTFVLQDLGLFRFEDYPLSRQQRLFPDRPALERFQHLRRLSGLSHRLDELEGLADWLAEALWLDPGSRQEQRQRDRTLNRLGRWFERGGRFDAALNCYGLSRMHPARERRARILTKLGDPCGALALAGKMGATPSCAEEVDFARRFDGRQLRRARATAHDVTELRLVEKPLLNIEAHAAELLSGNGGVVFHLENAFPLGLAGLAFWDVVFSDVPGAFANPFQSGPLDLFWPDFADTRSASLEARSRELSDPELFRQALRRTYREKHGVTNRLISWRHFSESVLDSALDNIPTDALLALARHVVRWPYRTRNGFPDLVVIYGPGSYEFVEVKGPTDQLQPAQRVWLKALRDMNHPARVLKFKAC